MNFEDDEEWDLDLLDKLVQSEEQAIAARRGVSSTPIPFSSLPPHPPPLSHSLRLVVSQPPEKQDDSTVFDLQQRLRQAELELSELQRKAQQNTAAASSATVEELQRLQTEILFKDQEILQVKRTCVEKSEQLKRLNTENEELRKHLEEIKRFKWEEGSNTGVVRKDCKESETRNLKSSLAENQIANQDLWYPPWAPTVSTADGSKSKSASPQDGPQRKNSSIDSQKLDSQFQSRGCTPSNGEIKSHCNDTKQDKTLKTSTACGTVQGRVETYDNNKRGWGHPFLCTLLNIWSPRNMKEESKGVVPKLLSVCEDDIQILLSMDTSADEKQHIRNNMRSLNEPSKHANEPAMRISTAASRGCSNVLAPCKLRSILGQVANGLISSWSLFLTILELSEGENVEVSESALRVLLCLITRDEGCQNRLFRRNTSALQPRVLKAVASGHFSKNNALLPASVPFEGLSCDLSVNAVLNKYFPSSRISWYNEASPQCQDNAQEVSGQDNLKLQINKESCEEASRNHISSDKSTQFALMRRIFEGALNKAVKGYNRTISITAVSILIVIVANSEPMSSREDFGFALFDGSIASLLKVSVALEVRSQAVRLVHSLLHCPAVLSRLLKVKDVYDEQESEVSRPVEEVMQGTDINARIAEEEVAVQHGDEITGLCQTERNVNCSGENSRYDVLEGLISSLANAGFTTQAYTLKRHVLRVLTYITISDHRGAAFLLEKQFVVNPTGISLKNPDKSKEEKFPAIMQTGSLPMHLIGFIDEELKIEGLRENSVAFEPNEERECVLCEMLTLLCRFASHSTESLRTIRLLSTDKNIARISISVINRVMNRSFLSVRPKFQGQQVTSSVDIIELCRGLRRRILSNLSDM